MNGSGWFYIVAAINCGYSMCGLANGHYPLWWGFGDALLAVLVVYSIIADRRAGA